MRRAAEQYRAAAAEARKLAAEYRARAVEVPEQRHYGPCPAHPGGWTSTPRANLIAAAESAARRAAESDELAARIEASR